MKVFDLELAKQGNPVQTRKGNPARIVCYDKLGERKIGALIKHQTGEGREFEEFHSFYENGKLNESSESELDLMMVPIKKEGWINIYSSNNFFAETGPTIHKDKENAIKYRGNNCIETIKIEWEE